jgi:SOS-response transcriptional repressor LexA
MEEKGILERIKRVMDYVGENQSQFAARIGFAPQNLGQILRGNRGVPRSLVNKIADTFPEINREWLYAGEGKMEVDLDVLGENSKSDMRPRLPITAAAGTLSEYLTGIKMHECDMLPMMRSMPEYDFTMIIKGDSMEPKFEGGDEIACKKVEHIIEPGKTYVLATKDGAVVKRLYPEENGIRCVSYNHDEYPDFQVQKDDILGVYKVVGLIRV